MTKQTTFEIASKLEAAMNSKPTKWKYRITYTYRHWIGKPDPTNMGQGGVICADFISMRIRSQELAANGHRVDSIEDITTGRPVAV
jgi:hypothetical protein